MSKFATNYTNRRKYEGEILDNTKIVDTLGFIPHKEKISNYINAGINLAKARAEQYDADANVDPKDIPHNPYRDVGKDFADIHRSKQNLERAIEAKILAQKQALKLEEERKKKYEENNKKTTETPKNSAESSQAAPG